MTFVFLFVLAVAWTVYLVTWLHGRSEHRNVNSISSFSKHLSVLERTSPSRAGFSTVTARPAVRPVIVPSPAHVERNPRPSGAMTLSAAQRRRRDLLTGLGVATFVSVAAAGLVGGVFVPVALVSLVLLGSYAALLARARQLQVERAEKVRYLHDDAAIDEWYEDDGDIAFAR